MEKTKEEVKEILKNMTWSYSSVNTFETCPYSFKLTYLDREKRAENIFSQVGNSVHSTFEEYFKGEVEIFEMDNRFLENYQKYVKLSPPRMLLKYNYEEKNIDLISKYFRNMDLSREDFEVLCIEDKIEYAQDGIKIVVKPDLIVRRLSDGKVTLYDYKTSSYKKDSHSGYAYQCSLYACLYEKVKGVHIDEMNIIYVKEQTKRRGEQPKFGRIIPMVYDEKVLGKFYYGVSGILAEREWNPKLEQFFCNEICSMRKICGYKENTFGV